MKKLNKNTNSVDNTVSAYYCDACACPGCGCQYCSDTGYKYVSTNDSRDITTLIAGSLSFDPTGTTV